MLRKWHVRWDGDLRLVPGRLQRRSGNAAAIHVWQLSQSLGQVFLLAMLLSPCK